MSTPAAQRWRIRLIVLLLAQVGALASAAPHSDEELAAKIDRYFTRYAEFGFSGALLVARDGRVVLKKGYGSANDERGLPYTADTVFDTGSITKVLTATAILKLEAQGKLRVTDSIARYLPGVPSDKQGITLAQLLSHSSGIQIWGEEDYEPVDRDEYVRRALAAPLSFAPGRRTAYSNAGFSLLGAIIERVSGKCWEEYLDENVFKPAGMTQTGYRASKWQRAHIAHGYPTNAAFGSVLDYPGPYQPRADDCYPGAYWSLATNGGALSTLDDLLKFDQALYSETLLPENARRSSTKRQAPHPEWGNGTDYSYGWDVTTTARGTTLIHKTGSSDLVGIGAWLMRYVDEHTTIILATNRMVDGMLLNRLMGVRLDGLVFGEDPVLPPAAATEPWIPGEYVGVYRLSTGETLAVSADRKSLRIEGRGRAARTLLAFGGHARPEDGLQQEVLNLVDALDREDVGTLRSMLVPETWIDLEYPQRDGFWNDIEDFRGPLLGGEVVAIVPGVFVRNLFMNARFSGGTQLIVLQQNRGGRFLIPDGRDAMPVPSSLRFVPQDRDAFASFSLVTGPGVPVRFERDMSGRPVRLIAVSAAGSIVAWREPRD